MTKSQGIRNTFKRRSIGIWIGNERFSLTPHQVKSLIRVAEVHSYTKIGERLSAKRGAKVLRAALLAATGEEPVK